MDINHGREFIELARCLNFTEAASNLNMTQPALSKHILALEKEFGTELLDRSRKGVQLTEAGRILFENASTMVDAYDKAVVGINLFKNRKPVHIAGNMDDSDMAILAAMSTMLARENYQAAVVFDRNHEQPLEQVLSGEADACIGYIDPEVVTEARVRLKKFTSTQLLAVMSTSHPFAKNSSVTWEDLRNQTFIKFMGDKVNSAWGQIEAHCKKHGYVPRTRNVSALNNVEFFSAPLHDDILIWKASEKQIGLLLETKHRAGIPLSGDDAFLTSYIAYLPENEEKLTDFFKAIEDARTLLNSRKGKN